MADLDSYTQRERHARALARHYGLAPHGVELRATLPPGAGAERAVIVRWLEAAEQLVRAGLVTRDHVATLLERRADDPLTPAAVRWVDAAGTRWLLCTNGGLRGDEYGLWLTAWYPDESVALPAEAQTPAHTRRVEALVRAATGRPIRFSRPRGRAT